MRFSRQDYWSGLLFSRGSSQPRDQTCSCYVSRFVRWVLYHSCHLGSPSRAVETRDSESMASDESKKAEEPTHGVPLSMQGDRVDNNSNSNNNIKNYVYMHINVYMKCATCSVMSSSLRPKNCSLPGSSVHGVSQARIL